jgi:hypothetical protein
MGRSVPTRRPYRTGLITIVLVLILVLSVLPACGGEQSVDGGDDDGAPEAESEDTGRMSDGEYGLFQTMNDEVIKESQQWNEELQACAQIGLAGDFAGFRDCIQEGYEGFEDAVGAALFNAEDTFDDVGKQCLETLTRYRNRLDDFGAANQRAYRVANALDFDGIRREFKRLPKATRQFSRVAIATLSSCEPS